jgi:tetratricopeptide (TPR) repeat protein
MEPLKLRSSILESQSLASAQDCDIATLLRCAEAQGLTEAGDYESARAALGELWQKVGQRPQLSGLSNYVQAEVLLRSGALSGWIGSAHQLDGAQEVAKNLLTEAISLFSELGEAEKEAEAHVDLGICYWREGAFSEARIMFQSAAGLSPEGIQHGRALMNHAIVELADSRNHEALRLLKQAAPIFDASDNLELKGRVHLQLSLVFRRLGTDEQSEEYIDRALEEATAASYHFEQTGNRRYEAIVENNMGFLCMKLGRYMAAQVNLDRARRLFETLHDRVNVARVDDTRAKVLVAETRYHQAEQVASTAVQALEKGEEQAVLAEALTTLGMVQARQHKLIEARCSLERAASVAEAAGDVSGAGLACLTMIEELPDHLSPGELISTYRRADAFLERSNEGETIVRLRRCARIVMQALPHIEASFNFVPGKSYNLLDQSKQFVRQFEALAIKRVLEEEKGSITRAARRLGLSHQTLDYKLTHDDELSAVRKPKRRRHRTIITKK